MKKLLLAALVISLVGTAGELLLIEHFEGLWQIIPLLLIAIGITAISWFSLKPTKRSKQLLQVIMALFMVSGFLGFALHFNGNMEFELEMYPSMKGTKLIWETLKGATPVLAPGSMIATGLFGWAYALK